MKALLRFQAVVLARTVSRPTVLLQLVALAAFVAWSSLRLDEPHAGLAVAFAVTIAVGAMSQTFDAVESVRWIAPMRRSDAVRAHVVFWLTVCGPPAAIVAAAHAQIADGAAILFFHLALVVVAAAALMMFFQRVTRRGVGAMGMVAGVVVGSVLVGPAAWSLYLAWTGRWESLVVIGVVAGVSWALGVRPFLRDELEPSASGGVVDRRAFHVDERGPSTARSPVASVLRATYPPLWTGMWVVFGGVMPLVVPSMGVAAIWTPIAASNLAGLGLQSWRWLAATPIDRNRAFRIIFGPTLAFVLVVTAARLVVAEAGDRSVFFDDFRRESIWIRAPGSTLRLYKLLDHWPDGAAYMPPQVPIIATRVQQHLQSEYGLVVATERIEADIRRGWPERPSTGIMDSDQTSVLDAMERVRVDLADEISGATRRRDFVVAAGLVLAFLVLLRVQFAGRLRGVVLGIVVGLPLVTLAIFRRDLPAFAEAADRLYAAMSGAAPTVLWFALAAACALGALFWRSARNAFRRIDLLDLPPNPLAPRRR